MGGVVVEWVGHVLEQGWARVCNVGVGIGQWELVAGGIEDVVHCEWGLVEGDGLWEWVIGDWVRWVCVGVGALEMVMKAVVQIEEWGWWVGY